MPSISAHMIVADKVSKILKINSDEFIRGNLLPDIVDTIDSHKKIESDLYLVPDIDYFLNNLDLTNDLYIGYLVHLLLDKHYLENYLPKIQPNKHVFLDNTIYKDYDYLNYPLVKLFNLDVINIEKILNNYNCKISEEKLKYNIDCLKQKTEGKPIYLDLDSFSKFLKEISITISEELIKYADKYNIMCIHTR